MSNIVVSEEQILNAEECRVIQRTNLRNQGVGCKDDEDMRSLVGKTDDIQSWVDLLNGSISGALYSDTLTTIPYSNILKNKPNITSIILTLSDPSNVGFENNTGLKTLIMPSISTHGQYFTRGCTSLEKLIMPKYNQNNSSGNAYAFPSSFVLFDFGSTSAINGNTNLSNLPNFKYFILRKSDSITTLDNTSRLSGSSPLTFVPQAQISNYEGGTNWSATSCTFLSLEGSRFESLDWWETVYNQDGTPKNTCTLDGNLIETADNETVAILKHTENISHCYENGVELQDTDLVKGKTLTSTI